MTKLTLSMDAAVVATAKRLAKQHRTSVSAMLANMVRVMAAQEESRPQIPPDSITARLTGIIKLPPGETDDDVLYEALCERYGIEPR